MNLGGSGCSEANPCQACYGDCDDDHDCAPGLKCFGRTYGEPVPGCVGDSSWVANFDAEDLSATPGSYDICYDPTKA